MCVIAAWLFFSVSYAASWLSSPKEGISSLFIFLPLSPFYWLCLPFLLFFSFFHPLPFFSITLHSVNLNVGFICKNHSFCYYFDNNWKDGFGKIKLSLSLSWFSNSLILLLLLVHSWMTANNSWTHTYSQITRGLMEKGMLFMVNFNIYNFIKKEKYFYQSVSARKTLRLNRKRRISVNVQIQINEKGCWAVEFQRCEGDVQKK